MSPFFQRRQLSMTLFAALPFLRMTPVATLLFLRMAPVATLVFMRFMMTLFAELLIVLLISMRHLLLQLLLLLLLLYARVAAVFAEMCRSWDSRVTPGAERRYIFRSRSVKWDSWMSV